MRIKMKSLPTRRKQLNWSVVIGLYKAKMQGMVEGLVRHYIDRDTKAEKADKYRLMMSKNTSDVDSQTSKPANLKTLVQSVSE